MDLRRLRVGEWVLALSGVALLVSLFLPWYERGESGVSGWESFAVIDVLLAAVAAFALVAVVTAATQPTTALPISFESLTVIFGLVASVLALVRVLDVPDLGAPGYGTAAGAYLGLAGSVGLAAGALVAIRDERLSPPGKTTDMTGRPVPPPPEIEAIPPPRPEGR
jgi:hypothetical protein